MKKLIFLLIIIITTDCSAMQQEDMRISFENDEATSALERRLWARGIVSCIEKRNNSELLALLDKAPIQRNSNYPFNANIQEEIKAHRDDQLKALRTCSPRKVWNKICAVSIDIGLPLTAFGVGLADGIIAQSPTIIALSSIYLVLSLKTALKDMYAHWTMKAYEDKVEEFDVWLTILSHLERRTQHDPLLPAHDNSPLEDTHTNL